MNHFLVRLGKSKYGEHLMPALNCVVLGVYTSVQFLCHDQLRDLFGAQSISGCREKISTHLRNLIQETHDACVANDFDPPDFMEQRMSLPKSPISWFASSTLEPISFGCTKVKTGITIGLPNFYNFTTPEDIPDSSFEIKKLALFRSAQNKDEEMKHKAGLEKPVLESQDNPPSVVRKIDRHSKEGEEFSNSLLLSDDAKRFSIARELYLTDTSRVIFKITSVFISIALAISVGRTFVKRLNLKQGHISNRIPFYMTSGLLGYGNNYFLSTMIDQAYASIADENAMKLGKNYEAGAKEYFEKRAIRRNILGIN